jgi:putative phosphoribosyl transferase
MFIETAATGSTGRSARETQELLHERPIAIVMPDAILTASLSIPRSPIGVAIVAGDRGCGRHRGTFRALARELRGKGFATVLVDVLTPDEQSCPEGAASLRLDAQLLARRIDAARDYAAAHPRLSGLPLVLVGSGGAGAAALLSAAARRGVAALVAAVSQPHLTGIDLSRSRVATLLCAAQGQLSDAQACTAAMRTLGGERSVLLVPGRTLEDPAAAAQLARAAAEFARARIDPRRAA